MPKQQRNARAGGRADVSVLVDEVRRIVPEVATQEDFLPLDPTLEVLDALDGDLLYTT